MQSLFGGGELGLLGGGDGGGLKDDGCGGVAWRSSPLRPDDVYSASHFALVSAYQDIKTRLALLERENTGIKRKLKIYEIKVRRSNICTSFNGIRRVSCGSSLASEGRSMRGGHFVLYDSSVFSEKGSEPSTLRIVEAWETSCTEIKEGSVLLGFDSGPAGGIKY